MRRTSKPQTPKTHPSWIDVKRLLAEYEHAALLALVSDLYALSADNQAFLHARLTLGEYPLKPYKDTIERWLFPDLFRNQDYSVAKAKKAIAEYRKAVGDATGRAELMTYFCEQAAGFATDIALDDEGYYDALVRMFDETLKALATVPAVPRAVLLPRLQRVCELCAPIGYGVGDDLAMLLGRYLDKQEQAQARSPM